jgi:hypothetical protein
MNEYRIQVRKGTIQKAYKGLMEYMMGLRTHFGKKFPEYVTSGSLYYGYMDVTYFSISPATFKQRGLKAVILFFHETSRFDIWLCGYNKNFQTKYWNLFKENNWDKYHLVPTTKGYDSILEHSLVADPEFNDLKKLTNQIEQESVKFISDVKNFLLHLN